MTIAGGFSTLRSPPVRPHARTPTTVGRRRATAARFNIAHRTESETAKVRAPLPGIGYHLLADRPWPGSRTAQVDKVIGGSAGAFFGTCCAAVMHASIP